ncbi:hypothetical protein LF1_37650 [Rubripirellula obstinata]|uniref:Uncharacterized protein n=1 Tax=Rubripirellula obstinata TaxID=406547 RepID=A0A5B1CN56_9BACT|nr:hypothetical protein [Rubripirellula obstinata]KAA1261219.1 hypothetical protein LF1_37650 [Rubripirellula obstinata]
MIIVRMLRLGFGDRNTLGQFAFACRTVCIGTMATSTVRLNETFVHTNLRCGVASRFTSIDMQPRGSTANEGRPT